jgi:membrane protease YdiL (CAAX protease family)
LIIVAAIAAVVMLGEEVGWRGFLLPRMQQLTTPRRAAILTAAAHAAVHLPVILLTTTYNSQGSRWIIGHSP